MPKALSGEMLADRLVPIDRREHHSFDKRVKATAPNHRASSATLRSILPQAAAILEKGSIVPKIATRLTRASNGVTGFSASSRSRDQSGASSAMGQE
jgi:hypothetical protein